MSQENKAIVRRFFEEVVNNGNMALAEELVAANYAEHPPLPGAASGLAGFKQFAAMLVTAFPDLHVTIEDLVAEGDQVAARITVRGTHQGMFMGEIPPTGKRVEWAGVDIFRFDGGKVVERWNLRDLLGLMQQLGAIRSATPPR